MTRVSILKMEQQKDGRHTITYTNQEGKTIVQANAGHIFAGNYMNMDGDRIFEIYFEVVGFKGNIIDL